MRKVTVEEHFAIKEQLDAVNSIINNTYPNLKVAQEEKMLVHELPFLYPSRNQNTVNKLLDIGEGRISLMDRDGIDVQVLSLVSPGVQVFDAATGTAIAKIANDRIAEAVRKYPGRFDGLASIAPQNPSKAAQELERAVKDLGLKGALINSHTKGEYLDDKKYWVIFEMAEKLGVPLYIHPRCPSPDMIKPYLAYPRLHTAMLGFSAEVSLHVMRLICSGVFDQFPDLTIILGHLGEALPYWLWRIDNMWQMRDFPNRPERLPSEYFQDNFYISTSGMFWYPPLLCACMVMGADRILFAVDYPIESNKKAVQFIETAPISKSDKEKIFHQNAQKLFKLKNP